MEKKEKRTFIDFQFQSEERESKEIAFFQRDSNIRAVKEYKQIISRGDFITTS